MSDEYGTGSSGAMGGYDLDAIEYEGEGVPQEGYIQPPAGTYTGKLVPVGDEGGPFKTLQGKTGRDGQPLIKWAFGLQVQSAPESGWTGEILNMDLGFVDYTGTDQTGRPRLATGRNKNLRLSNMMAAAGLNTFNLGQLVRHPLTAEVSYKERLNYKDRSVMKDDEGNPIMDMEVKVVGRA